ncbi:MAG: mechanosensitive ion channel [Methanosarcinales archaeon]|nr:mechanosensitive ion channel [Methanosarcinales archaeon]
MVRRLINFGILILLGLSLWFADQWFPEIYLKEAVNTVFAFALVYLLFKIVLEDRFIGRIRDSRTRYFFNKLFTTVYFIVFGLLLLAIWVEDLQAVLVGFGLIAAGLTIALQEVAKNFVGGLLILINNLYSVGDRIEINSKLGDVIDIGMFSTTIMETNEWISGDQPTGRLSVIPNGQVLNSVVNNYTRDFNFIWERSPSLSPTTATGGRPNP